MWRIMVSISRHCWLLLMLCFVVVAQSAEPITTASVLNQRISPMLVLQIGEHRLTATFAENSSADALKQRLAGGPIVIDMKDYAGMEKVGDLGFTLPRNDKQIDTEAGDIILYLGKAFVIYYGENSWSLTRLARVNNVSPDELKRILIKPRISVVLSLSDTD